jgi:iron complex transport system substrate-binding protein
VRADVGGTHLFLKYSSNRILARLSKAESLRSLCLRGELSPEAAHHGDAEITEEAKRRPAPSSPHRLLIAALLVCLLGSVASCWKRPSGADGPSSKNTSSRSQFREDTDEAGRTVSLPLKVERVVSLAPNLTEIVFAIGGGNKLVGDTTYCDYPAEARSIAKVGDTLHPSVERIIALRPQLVLVSTASQLESFTREMDEHQITVYVTDPHDLDGVFRSIEKLGTLLGKEDESKKLVRTLRDRSDAVEKVVRSSKRVRVFYQVSNEPLYTAGRDSFVTDLIERAGGMSVTADVPGAWPRFSNESALAAQPDVIILPTGGSMGSANSDVAQPLKRSPAAIAGRVYKINDDYLSRPGPRLVDGLEQMAHALHPEAFKQ